MVPGHGCSAYCTGEEHCDLVYSADDPREDLLRYSIARHYEDQYRVRVLRVRPATEAPDISVFSAAQLVPVAGTGTPQGQRQWLVWWKDEPPPTHGGRRLNTGGARPGAGRKPSPVPRVRVSTTLRPETDARIRREQRDGETYGEVIDRLLEEMIN